MWKQIEGLKVDDVDDKADIWTMSPPCQPCENCFASGVNMTFLTAT
jgi:hypothetical protein